ncbi:MAG TPA: efflux RND transporter permease subunit [Pirellulales bacterium]|jgi:multidrug efflux pump|nr:efflux RND transporter permease subunit [Pirellulales bacterium]
MISRFFIDRPIFASVLSIVITLIGGISLTHLPVAQYPRITPPGVSISINYPGASAQVVADTVASPIEQQVNGVQGMLYMTSQMSNDGLYTLTVTFEIGTDINTAVVMVQNRVALALPQLPSQVQNQGITIRKRTPDILMIVNFYSPDRRYDDVYLSNYATINIKDELLRVAGVSDITYQGQRDYSIRAWLNPQKLASLNMTPIDVANAIRQQNIDAPAGQIGQAPSPPGQSLQLPIDTLGQISDPEQFGEIIVKAVPATAGQAIARSARPTQFTMVNVGPSSSPVAAPSTTTASSSGTTNGISTTAPAGAAATSPTGGLAGGGTSTGGGSAAGGGTTGGGSTAAGGGTTGNSATGSAPTGMASGSIENLFASLGSGRMPPQPSAAIVRLKDVARLELGAQNYNQSCTFDGNPAVGLGVYQVPEANALEVANRVRAKMEELKTRFPEGVAYDIAYDITPYIRDSIIDVIFTLLEAISLVAIVVLIFLQNWRSVVIPLVAVPVAIIGTFSVMAAIGFSLNNISLFGLVLAIGIVVDDAIVVVENVERWLDHGLTPKEAARRAMDEVTGPIIAVALVLCAVFVPCAFIVGITGQFFRQFAVTIAVSTVFSAINSLTLSPALAAILLRPRGARRDPATWVLDILLGWFFWLFNKGFGASNAIYAWLVGILMRVSAIVLLLYLGLVGLTYYTFHMAPTGFVPAQDQGRAIVNIQLPDSSSLQRTQAAVAQIDKIVRETPGVAHTIAIAGLSFVQGSTSPNFASMFVVLKPFEERQKPSLRDTAIMAKIRSEWAKHVKDAQVTIYGTSPVPGLGAAGGFKFYVEDSGGLGLKTLQQETDELTRALQNTPGLVKPNTLFRSNAPQLYLEIDRTKAAALGCALEDVNQTLDMYLGSLYVNSFNDFGRHWQVTIQAEGQYRNRVEDVNLFQVRNKMGQMVPLGTLLNLRDIGGPINVSRFNRYTGAAITGSVQNGTSNGEAIERIEEVARKTLPLSMKTDWTELMFMQLRAGNTSMYFFALAVVCVFLSLSALYESWSLPLAVILVVPLCLLCSLAGVLGTHRDMNIFVQIGFFVLVGLACKNAILIVEFARQLHEDEHKPRFEATKEAARMRLRPILMTSFAFIFGVIPLMLASGPGAEMRRSLGTAVFSGMLGVTLFGIFLTPVFFYVIEGLGESKFFTAERTKWVGSSLFGGAIGLAIGYLLNGSGLIRTGWAPAIGAAAGVLLMLGLLSITQKLKLQLAGTAGAARPANQDAGEPPSEPTSPPHLPPPAEGEERR